MTTWAERTGVSRASSTCFLPILPHESTNVFTMARLTPTWMVSIWLCQIWNIADQHRSHQCELFRPNHSAYPLGFHIGPEGNPMAKTSHLHANESWNLEWWNMAQLKAIRSDNPAQVAKINPERARQAWKHRCKNWANGWNRNCIPSNIAQIGILSQAGFFHMLHGPGHKHGHEIHYHYHAAQQIIMMITNLNLNVIPVWKSLTYNVESYCHIDSLMLLQGSESW